MPDVVAETDFLVCWICAGLHIYHVAAAYPEFLIRLQNTYGRFESTFPPGEGLRLRRCTTAQNAAICSAEMVRSSSITSCTVASKSKVEEMQLVEWA